MSTWLANDPMMIDAVVEEDDPVGMIVAAVDTAVEAIAEADATIEALLQIATIGTETTAVVVIDTMTDEEDVAVMTIVATALPNIEETVDTAEIVVVLRLEGLPMAVAAAVLDPVLHLDTAMIVAVAMNAIAVVLVMRIAIDTTTTPVVAADVIVTTTGEEETLDAVVPQTCTGEDEMIADTAVR